MAANLSGSDLEDSVNVELDGTTSTPRKHTETQGIFPGSCKASYQVGNCPVKNVTVFLDRAEVNRVVDVSVTHNETEVVIRGLPVVIDQDSLRVQCRGDATIVEVKYSETTRKDDNADKLQDENESKKAALNAQIEGLEKEKNVLAATLAAHEQKMKVLMGYSERVGQSNKECDKVVELFEKKSLENLSSFLSYLFTNTENINKLIHEGKEKAKVIDKAIADAKAHLDEITPAGKDSKKERCVSVMLEGKVKCDVELVVSYVVSNASWSPVYDLRAFSGDNLIQLLYFGVIRQTTGEDWNDALVALSTAMPSVGGSAPEVPTQELSVHFDAPLLKAGAFGGSSRSKRNKKARSGMMETAYDIAPRRLMQSLMSADAASDDEEYAALPTAMVTEGVTSTCFEILRPSTIKSDNSEHKVSISLIELTPEFQYEISPKFVAHAFLKATVKNESEFALLAGPANVFLDNNFLTKSSLAAVSPAEKFSVSLGADPAVKVTYHPLKKYQHNAGIFTKVVKLNYAQKITVQNTKMKQVTVKVTDQVPKSNNEKIKVHLTSPDIPPPPSKPDPKFIPPVQINSKNNIEWYVQIDAGKEKDLSFSYTVEFPHGLQVNGL